jgi:hypothetical protein
MTEFERGVKAGHRDYEAVARAMLAALKAIKDDVAVVKLGKDDFARCNKARKQVRAAIAQAEAAGITVRP